MSILSRLPAFLLAGSRWFNPRMNPDANALNSREYVVVATSRGGIDARTMRDATGVVLPPDGATLWVFALPFG